MKKRKDKKTVVIKVPKKAEVIKNGDLSVIKLGDEYFIRNESLGKRLKNDSGLISTHKKRTISSVFLSNSGVRAVYIDVTSKVFESFLKSTLKDIKHYKKLRKQGKDKGISVILRHISPDVTFVIDYSK